MAKSLHHSFDIDLAAEYGLEEAILIHHFQHWIQINKRLKRNSHEGKTWTYQTLNQIAAYFPYWSVDQIVTLLERLTHGKSRFQKEKQYEPVLLKGNFNKDKTDHTLWYAFVNEEKFIILGNHKIQDIVEPQNVYMTDTKPDSKTNLQVDDSCKNEETPPRENTTQQNSEHAPKNLILQKKEILDKLPPATLSDVQVKTLCNNHTLQDLENAVNYYLLQKNIEKPYTWLSNCLRQKYWQDADQKELTQFTLFNTLKTAIFALQQKIGKNLNIDSQKEYLFFNTPKGGLEIKPQYLAGESRIKEIISVINDSFNSQYKLCYVNLPGLQKFETL